MKMKLVFALVVFIFAGSAAFSQGGRTVEERVKSVMEKLSPALNLSEAQKAATDTVYTNYYKGFQKMREEMQEGTRPDRSVMEKMTADRDEKLRKIFTAEQFKKFKDEVEASLRPQRRSRD